MDLGLRDRAAIVTGASRGIGRAVAERLLTEGCGVLLCGRDPVALEEAASSLGPHAVAVAAVDVTDADAGDRLVAACLEAFGRLDIVVNNAGTATVAALDELTDDDWRAAFEVHLFGAVRLARACMPVMQAAGWGRLIHIASISGREPDPAFAPYSAAKAALLNFSGSLSRAHAGDGVLSSCVVPGITLTELVEANARAAAERAGTTTDEIMASMLRRHRVPTGRFGEPDEVAAAVAFLASDAAAWITGATLEVDGGTLRSV